MRTTQIPTARFIPTAALQIGDSTAMGEVTDVRRTAKTTFITVALTSNGEAFTYRQATNSEIFATTAHRGLHGFAHVDESRPEACLCGAMFVDGYHLDVVKRAHLSAVTDA